MSAHEIESYVLLFPNEEWGNYTSDAQLEAVVAQVAPNISFYQDLQDHIQTLSIQNADQNGVSSGFLYVPDIDMIDDCYNISKGYVPANVTRQANLPPTDFSLVGLAPWISAECTLAYLHAARKDPIRAFIFYLPDDSTSTPPAPASSVWDLKDGGSWKTHNQYPVYAIPGYYGNGLMQQLSFYSGNLTNVPYGHQISELPGIDPRDYVRLYTDIENSNSTTLPRFWVFLLLVIAILVIILGATSAAMHIIQRRRRLCLRRRVASGEVNLEALGIKRLTVPRDVIETLPLFIYNDESEKPLQSSQLHERSITATATEQGAKDASANAHRTSQPEFPNNAPSSLPETIIIGDGDSSPGSVIVHKFLPYSQPTCPICLDDYVSGITEIRELSCGHIFHPECIDTFLGSNSSLCPLCKKSALPPGHCPTKITNAMVRREYKLRRLRPRLNLDDRDAQIESKALRSRIKHLGLRIKNVPIFDPQPSSELSPMPQTPLFWQQPLLMTNAMPTVPQPSVLGQEVPQGPTRQEVVAQRLREMAAGQVPIQDPDVVNERRQIPQWRKTLSKAFPGFT